MKIKVPVKVLDKRRKDGWLFGSSFYVIVRMYGHDEDPTSPIGSADPSVQEFEVEMDAYYKLEVGVKYLQSFYEHSDGKFYPYTE